MLEVGNGGMTVDEYRSHFSLWALMKVRVLTLNAVLTTTLSIASGLLVS
jgi:hypothetical protein